MRVVQIEPGPMPTLTASAPSVDERFRGRRGGDVAADHLGLRIRALDPAHAIEHALRVAVRGIDDDHVGAGFDQRFDALFGAFAYADRRAHAQAAQTVLAGDRMLGGLQDVLDRDQAAQLEVLVDDEHALEPVLVHERQRFFARRAFAHGDELLARRHDVPDRLVELGLEPQIAVGDDADHACPTR